MDERLERAWDVVAVNVDGNLVVIDLVGNSSGLDDAALVTIAVPVDDDDARDSLFYIAAGWAAESAAVVLSTVNVGEEVVMSLATNGEQVLLSLVASE